MTGLFEYPVTLAELGVVVQVNCVPGMEDVRVMAVAVLLQILLFFGLFDRSG